MRICCGSSSSVRKCRTIGEHWALSRRHTAVNRDGMMDWPTVAHLNWFGLLLTGNASSTKLLGRDKTGKGQGGPNALSQHQQNLYQYVCVCIWLEVNLLCDFCGPGRIESTKRHKGLAKGTRRPSCTACYSTVIQHPRKAQQLKVGWLRCRRNTLKSSRNT